MQEHTTNEVKALVEGLTEVLEDVLEEALPLTQQERQT